MFTQGRPEGRYKVFSERLKDNALKGVNIPDRKEVVTRTINF